MIKLLWASLPVQMYFTNMKYAVTLTFDNAIKSILFDFLTVYKVLALKRNYEPFSFLSSTSKPSSFTE